MNIHQLLANSKTQQINISNYQKLIDTANSIGTDYIGQNGTIQDDIIQTAKRIKKCSTSATIATKHGKTKMLDVFRCHSPKFCPTCADVAAGKRIAKLREELPKQDTKNIKYAYMITATVKSGSNLYERVNHLLSSWRRFYKMGKSEKGHTRNGELSKITGFVKSLEITYNEIKKEYHPHLHIIVFCNDRIDYTVYNEDVKKQVQASMKKDGVKWDDAKEFKRRMKESGGYNCLVSFDGQEIALSKLSAEWLKVTGDSVNLHCKSIWGTKQKPTPKDFGNVFEIDETTPKAERQAIKEIKYALKYSIKPEDIAIMPPEAIASCIDIFKSTRGNESGGFMRKQPEKRIEETEEEKQARREIAKLKTLAFCQNADIENVKMAGDDPESKTGKAQKAVWEWGADYEIDYKIAMIKAIAYLRKKRNQLFKKYQCGMITPQQYIARAERLRGFLSDYSRIKKDQRDHLINERSGGEYFRITGRALFIDSQRAKSFIFDDIERGKEKRDSIPMF